MLAHGVITAKTKQPSRQKNVTKDITVSQIVKVSVNVHQELIILKMDFLTFLSVKHALQENIAKGVNRTQVEIVQRDTFVKNMLTVERLGLIHMEMAHVQQGIIVNKGQFCQSHALQGTLMK
jgi:hypothetical protein